MARDRQTFEISKNHRGSMASLAMTLTLTLAGCGGQDVGAVPKLPPRGDLEKDIATQSAKPGAKFSPSQLEGRDDIAPLPKK